MKTPIIHMTEGAMIHGLDLGKWLELIKENEHQEKVIHQQKSEIDVLKGKNPNIKSYFVQGEAGWIQRMQDRECGHLVCMNENIHKVIDQVRQNDLDEITPLKTKLTRLLTEFEEKDQVKQSRWNRILKRLMTKESEIEALTKAAKNLGNHSKPPSTNSTYNL